MLVRLAGIDGDDAGMSTAEYAIGTIAAVAFSFSGPGPAPAR